MSAILNSKVTNPEGEFIVFTKSAGLFFRRHHRSSVMPFRVAGFLACPGFQIQYSTGDPRVLAEWHEMICHILERDSFTALVAQVKCGHFPYPQGKQHLAEFVHRIV